MTTLVLRLLTTECCKCGVPFGMSEDFVRRRQEDHANFFCPSGHMQFWPQESDLEALRKARDNALQRAQQLRNLLDDEREQHHKTERRLRSTRGVVTRTKARIAAGACPKCHARFPDLKNHMDTQHPGYATAHSRA